MDRGDLEREQDIEELRRIALAQHTQLQLLMELVDKQRRELGGGKSGDFQLTLKLLEELKAKAKQTEKLSRRQTRRSPSESIGPHRGRPRSRIYRSWSRPLLSTMPIACARVAAAS